MLSDCIGKHAAPTVFVGLIAFAMQPPGYQPDLQYATQAASGAVTGVQAAAAVRTASHALNVL